MKFLILTFALATVLSALTACDSPMNHRVEGDGGSAAIQTYSFKAFSLNAKPQWIKPPVGEIKTNNELMVIVTDAAGERVSLPGGYTLNFYATMPSMKHPLDDPGFFKEVDRGIYINSAIRYNMPGDWRNELWIMDSNLEIVDRLSWEEFF